MVAGVAVCGQVAVDVVQHRFLRVAFNNAGYHLDSMGLEKLLRVRAHSSG